MKKVRNAVISRVLRGKPLIASKSKLDKFTKPADPTKIISCKLFNCKKY